jgi:hypothetical protein
MPDSSPASAPAFSVLCTQTPTNSRSGRRWIAPIAILPIQPVAQTTTCAPVDQRTGAVGFLIRVGTVVACDHLDAPTRDATPLG